MDRLNNVVLALVASLMAEAEGELRQGVGERNLIGALPVAVER